jgi:hypothetical protein
MHVNLALVVIRAPGVHAPVPNRRLERRRVPQFDRIHRLYVIVAIHEQCGQIRIYDVFRDHDRLSVRGNNLDGSYSRTTDVLSYPLGTALDVPGVT